MATCEVEQDSEECELTEEDLIYINVCGMVYVTLESTLERFPSTLLGNRELRRNYFVTSKNAYFFDRHRKCFEAILYYYQSKGILNRPSDIPFTLFEQEVKFFGLGRKDFDRLHQKEDDGHTKPNSQPSNQWQRALWEVFEFPESSFLARIISFCSILVITTSIIVFCVETLPEQGHVKVIHDDDTKPHVQPLVHIELGCIIWFSVEYCMRFLSAPNKWQFLKSFLNVIDILAILPYYITRSLHNGHVLPLPLLKVVYLVRVFRILKFSRHSFGLQILGHTLRASVSELCMLMFFLFIGVILFSSAMYYVENEQGGQREMFSSIPDTFWYSLVTMTTVGYGDKVPTTYTGRLIGVMCAVCGVLTLALPVPVIVSNFDFFYRRDKVVYKPKVCADMNGSLITESHMKETVETTTPV